MLHEAKQGIIDVLGEELGPVDTADLGYGCDAGAMVERLAGRPGLEGPLDGDVLAVLVDAVLLQEAAQRVDRHLLELDVVL